MRKGDEQFYVVFIFLTAFYGCIFLYNIYKRGGF